MKGTAGSNIWILVFGAMQHLSRGTRPGQPAILGFLKQQPIKKRTFASLESNQLQTACVDQSWSFCIWSGQAGKVVHRKCIHEGKWISFESEKHHSVLSCTDLFVRKWHVQWHPASTAPTDPWVDQSVSMCSTDRLLTVAESLPIEAPLAVSTNRPCVHLLLSPPRVIRSQVDSSERLFTWH